MPRKTIAIAGAAALSAGVLASCGGDEVSASEYVGSICTASGDFVTTLFEGGAALTQASTETDPEAGKEQLTTFFSDATEAAEGAASDIEDAGTPDVENGEEIADSISTAFDDVATSLSDAEGQIEDLPTDSPESFQAATEDLTASFQEDTAQIQEGTEQVGESEELEQAAAESEECQSVEEGLTVPEATGTTGP